MKKDLFVLFTVVAFGLISLGIILFLVNRGVGQQQNAKASKAAELAVDPSQCQGNPNAPARCFDCVKDTGAYSEINRLDFGCFSTYYGKTVGK